MTNLFFLLTSLVIRGDKDEHAVVCSGDTTYSLKIADTSNLLLFVPGCRPADQLTDSEDSAHVVHAQVRRTHTGEHKHYSRCITVGLCCRSGGFLTATGN